MDCHSLLQGIFLTQGSKPGLLCCKQILYCLSHQGSTCSVTPNVSCTDCVPDSVPNARVQQSDTGRALQTQKCNQAPAWGGGLSSPISQVKKMKVLKKRGRQREAEPAETEKAPGRGLRLKSGLHQQAHLSRPTGTERPVRFQVRADTVCDLFLGLSRRQPSAAPTPHQRSGCEK